MECKYYFERKLKLFGLSSGKVYLFFTYNINIYLGASNTNISTTNIKMKVCEVWDI